MNKIFCILIFTCNFAFAYEPCSHTNMSIATGELNPFISSSMQQIKAKVDVIVKIYQEQNKIALEKRNIYLKRLKALDEEIVLTKREIAENQANRVRLRKGK